MIAVPQLVSVRVPNNRRRPEKTNKKSWLESVSRLRGTSTGRIKINLGVFKTFCSPLTNTTGVARIEKRTSKVLTGTLIINLKF